MLKLYYILPENDPLGGSCNAAKAAIALREVDVPFEIAALDRARDLRPEDGFYRRAINPNGGTPAIDDNGFILWESGAVLIYLVETRGEGRLLGVDVQSCTRTLQRLLWGAPHCSRHS